MSPAVLYALLIGLNAAVNVPSLIHLLTSRKASMTISPAAQTLIDSLTSANNEFAAALAHASTASTAQAAEDLAGITAAAKPLTDAISAAAAPAPAPVAESE